MATSMDGITWERYNKDIIPDILDNYLVLDSDTIFLKPTTFFENNIPLYNYGTEYNLPYFIHMINLHPTFLADEKDADEMKRVHLALNEIVTRTIELGGTITGEHGVGLAKREWLAQQVGDASLSLMKLVKHSLDPRNLLNPGKIFH